MDDEELRSYAYLWDGSDPEWMVALTSDGADAGLPYHCGRKSVLLVDEDDELAAAVVRAMLAHGVPVVDLPG
jgi:hypothetical protein